MNHATTPTNLAARAGPNLGAAPQPLPGDPKVAPPPADDGPGGMIGEGEASPANVESVESETETRREGGMIGEG